MKIVTTKNYGECLDSSAEILLREGEIINRNDMEKEDGFYSSIVVLYRKKFWLIKKHNQECFSMGYSGEYPGLDDQLDFYKWVN